LESPCECGIGSPGSISHGASYKIGQEEQGVAGNFVVGTYPRVKRMGVVTGGLRE